MKPQNVGATTEVLCSSPAQQQMLSADFPVSPDLHDYDYNEMDESFYEGINGRPQFSSRIDMESVSANLE